MGRGISSIASTDGGPNLLKRKAFTFQLFVGRNLPLRVIEQRHKTEVHVQLLVAVEEGESGVVSNEINF